MLDVWKKNANILGTNNNNNNNNNNNHFIFTVHSSKGKKAAHQSASTDSMYMVSTIIYM